MEANPDFYPILTKQRPQAVCIQAACVGSGKGSMVEFLTEPLGLLSGMQADQTPNMQQRYAARGMKFEGFQRKIVSAMTLSEIIEKSGFADKRIDFLTMDIEGAELEALQAFSHDARVILVESNDEMAAKKLYSYLYISMGGANSYNAIRLINTHERAIPKPVILDDLVFFHKTGYQFGFWHHQFLKAKVLRFNLCHPLLDENYHVSDLNQRFQIIADRPNGMLSVFEQTLIPKEAIMHISEPCLNGHITTNGLSDLAKYGCKLPKLPFVNKQAHF